MFNFSFETLIYGVVTILLALSFHEFAHGWVAYKLGDHTPRLQGRLTLNPLAHLDPIGALLLLFAGFGWAKPVQVNPLSFKGNRKMGMVLVALAGPISNLLLAYISAIFMNIMTSGIIPANTYFVNFFAYFFQVNIILAIFNLIPLPPLDGWRVIGMIIPGKYYFKMQNVSQYSMLIILLLAATGILGSVLYPITNFVANILGKLAGL